MEGEGEQTSVRRPLKFMIAVDGSDASEIAYQLVAKDLFKDKNDDEGVEDHIVIGTVTDKKKDNYLPYNMKSNYLSDCYRAKLIQFGTHGSFVSQENEHKVPVRQLIWEMTENEKCDLIVTGNHGRKGPKADETVCGTLIEHTATSQSFPVLIIKDNVERRNKADQLFRFGVCFDNSEKSRKALKVTLNLMRQKDKLAVITVKDSAKLSEDFVKKYVHDEAAKFGVSNVTVNVLEEEEGKSTYQLIKHYLKYEASEKDNYIDFVAVGNGGMRFDSSDAKDFLGSVANSVLRARRMNVLFVP